MKNVSIIAAEDTRISKILCNEFSISTPLIRLDKYQEKKQCAHLLNILSTGNDIAIVSDAGTPTISDPGHYLITYLISHHIPIVPISGPSAITTLLSVSGFNADHYIFGGFFPKKEHESLSLLTKLAPLHWPIVFFESPRRLITSIMLLHTIYPKCLCVCGKELTKRYETIIRGTPQDILTKLKDITIKGEWSIVIHLPKPTYDINTSFLTEALKLGLNKKSILKLSASLGWKKNSVYQFLLDQNDT